MRNFISKNKKSGISYIEVIIYASILGVLTLVMISGVLSLSSSYKNLSVMRNVEHTAIDVLERLSRDIRGANLIDTANSTFGTSNGVLTLVSTDGSFSTTTRYYLSDGVANLDVNGVFWGPLSSSYTQITDMTFYQITTTNSNAVRVDLTVEATDSGVTKIKTYHTTVALKQI